MDKLVAKPKSNITKPGWREAKELFDYWERTMGTKMFDTKKVQYYAALRLVNKSGGIDNVKMLINGVKMSIGDRYAPHISNFIQLEQKANELIDWGKRKQTEKENNKVF